VALLEARYNLITFRDIWKMVIGRDIDFIKLGRVIIEKIYLNINLNLSRYGLYIKAWKIYGNIGSC